MNTIFIHSLLVIDYISLTRPSDAKTGACRKNVYVANPQGTITEEAIAAIKAALETNEHTHIVVEGEEDLLTLIAVLYAPENSFDCLRAASLGHSGGKSVAREEESSGKTVPKRDENFEKLNKKIIV